MNGRDYFRGKERELRIEGLDPAGVQKVAGPQDLKRGPRTSRVGGRIANDLKHLTAEETAQRQQRSKSFLSSPAKHFPADDAQDKNTS